MPFGRVYMFQYGITFRRFAVVMHIEIFRKFLTDLFFYLLDIHSEKIYISKYTIFTVKQQF